MYLLQRRLKRFNLVSLYLVEKGKLVQVEIVQQTYSCPGTVLFSRALLYVPGGAVSPSAFLCCPLF